MIDRAKQEVRGSGLERAIAELAILVDGDDDDWHVDQRRPAAQRSHEAGAVHLRHVEIGDDQIRHHPGIERLQRLRARETRHRQPFLDPRRQS